MVRKYIFCQIFCRTLLEADPKNSETDSLVTSAMTTYYENMEPEEMLIPAFWEQFSFPAEWIEIIEKQKE